jgi:excisionase family DNA binding protein
MWRFPVPAVQTKPRSRKTADPVAVLDPALNLANARAYLGDVSDPYIRQLAASGELPSIRLGKRLVFKQSDLDTYLNAHRQVLMLRASLKTLPDDDEQIAQSLASARRVIDQAEKKLAQLKAKRPNAGRAVAS